MVGGGRWEWGRGCGRRECGKAHFLPVVGSIFSNTTCKPLEPLETSRSAEHLRTLEMPPKFEGNISGRHGWIQRGCAIWQLGTAALQLKREKGKKVSVGGALSSELFWICDPSLG